METAMDKDISRIISDRYPKLSRTHKVLADYLRDNMRDLPFVSINELSARSGVSPASITRFTKQLSFSGYAEFQQHARKQVQDDLVPFFSLKTVLRNTAPTDQEHGGHLRDSINNTLRLLNAVYSDALDGALRQTAATTLGARRVYVVGHRSTYAVAYYLHFMLHNMRDNVFMLTSGSGETSGYLCDVTEEDCLLAVSYSRYSRFSRDVMKYFKEKNCPVCLLTDSDFSVITGYANTVLATKDAGSAMLVGAMMVANALITLLGKMAPGETLARLNKQDAIAIANGVYF